MSVPVPSTAPRADRTPFHVGLAIALCGCAAALVAGGPPPAREAVQPTILAAPALRVLAGIPASPEVEAVAPGTEAALDAAVDPEPEPVVVADPAPVAPEPVQRAYGASSWESFAACVIRHESGGNPTVYNTAGSGASGLFQDMPGTWGGYGGYANAADAPVDVQYAMNYELWLARGSSPWAGSGC